MTSEQPGPKEEIEELRARIDELDDLWRRAVAEQANLRKRHGRELEQARTAERALVASLLPPVVDDLERALAHAGSGAETIVEGVRAVRDRAVRLLAQLGFPRHEEVGVPFDPARHEAVGTSTGSGHPPGTVAEVVQPGYGDEEQQLRPALVVVEKADD